MRMGRLTVDQLDEHLWQVADVLRGELDASAFPQVVGPLLLLKRASDQPDLFRVPPHARWRAVFEHSPSDPGRALDRALHVLEAENPEHMSGLFRVVNFGSTPSRRVLARLVDHLDQVSLSDDDLDFRDGVGRAFDRFLVRTASLAGTKGADVFVPRAVCRLMTELVDPREGDSVADPHAGWSGMLLQAARYVTEHGGRPTQLKLYGQEKNTAAWLTGRINLLLHGVTGAVVANTEPLTEPLLADGYDLARFDRVLTVPPFSRNYVRHEVSRPERMRYGWVPEGGKKADLMFVQHVLATLRPEGRAAVVAPHGVLFRGGAEGAVRRGLIEDDRLEAVIGLGANVFHGTSIPACVLVLRGVHERRPGERGSVMFVDAEGEVTTSRSKNRLDAQHIAKIAGVFHRREELPGFSRVVSLEEIREQDFTLNIRRYVDADPLAEPLIDIGAALVGGVPWSEIKDHVGRFQAFGIGLGQLFVPDRPGYWKFPAEGHHAVAARIPRLADPRTTSFLDAVRRWWSEQGPLLVELSGTGRLFRSGLRVRLESSFCEELLPLAVLDRYQLLGAFASWWADHDEELRTLDAYGFEEVLGRRRAFRDWTGSPNRLPFVQQGQEASWVLEGLADGLCLHVEQLVSAELRRLVNTYLRWGERYAASMVDLEQQYLEAAHRLRQRITGLGYV
ncbi:class I SAM-dependent DNA methyltransferase [Streptomyces sp. NPDC019990]|uniref:class I SAM-dependent DNA methyltransferase n=1 Tax=Streptomyces sp. NPDC019990 TaxID=3154693 RepID=UPI003404FF99